MKKKLLDKFGGGPKGKAKAQYPSIPPVLDRYGVQIVHDPQLEVADIDLVCIHGLNGSAVGSWTDITEKGVSVFWLRDFLPSRLPRSRILTYGYDGALYGTRLLSYQSIPDIAEDLLTKLTLFRLLSSTQQRPVIFLAHSVGGIILKEALLLSYMANPSHNLDHLALHQSTKGIIFMGTPHQGTDDAPWQRTLSSIYSVFASVNIRDLEDLTRDSPFLQTLSRRYTAIARMYKTKYIYETKPSQLPEGGPSVIVPRASAVVAGHADAEALARHTDHLGLAKFVDTEDDGLTSVIGLLQSITTAEPYARRYHVEDRALEATYQALPSPPRRLADSTLYTWYLLQKRLGYPLWYASPSMDSPIEYQRAGIEIGDLGCIVDGSFDYYFNVCRSAADAVNRGRVPSGFTPFLLQGSLSIRHHPNSRARNSQYMSNDELLCQKCTIEDAEVVHVLEQDGFHYKLGSDEGAILILPEGADTRELRSLKRLEQYAKDNCRLWFSYMDELGIPTSDLCLVTGHDKTSSWGVACFGSASTKLAADFRFIMSKDSLDGPQRYHWRCHPPVIANSSESNVAGNQCVFLRGFHISRRVDDAGRSDITTEVTLMDGAGEEGYYRDMAPHTSSSPSSRFDDRVSTASTPSYPRASSSRLQHHGARSGTYLGTASSEGRMSLLQEQQPGVYQERANRDAVVELSSMTSSIRIRSLTPPPEILHPGHKLNRHALRAGHSNSGTIAITHDNDWCDAELPLFRVLLSDTPMDAIARFLEMGQFNFTIENNIASLQHVTTETDQDVQPRVEIMVTKLDKLIKRLKHDGSAKFPDLSTFLDAAADKSLNDRSLLLERVFVIMSRFGNSDTTPEVEELGDTLNQYAIDLLYNDPPSTYLSSPISAQEQEIPFPSKEAKQFYKEDIAAGRQPNRRVPYVFRAVDGSSANPLHPTLGRAGSPYARSVVALNPIPPSHLPDAGLVFDTLLRRPPAGAVDHFVPHPAGVSSLFFAFADLIIHCLYGTDHTNHTRNMVSSYLDLNVLYGSTDDEMDSVRRKDGKGGIWPDVFVDSRVLAMRPAVCALLILFNRNHNYTAEKLFSLNEMNSFKDPESFSDTPEGRRQKAAQDDEIFHKTRLVNCGFFIQVILRDYVGVILGLSRDGCNWRLNPLAPTRTASHVLLPRGEGNVVSTEFNTLYRWQSVLSQEDTHWTEDILRNPLAANVSKEEFHNHAARVDIKKWTFGGLQRCNDHFVDADLAQLLQDATASRAGAFRARGVPSAMRAAEIMNIEKDRSWGTCTLNEFRQFMGLKPYSTFQEWNSNKDIADSAERLYGHVDKLELHVGLHAEEAKAPGPGSGMCPGSTLSRAILVDMVCLTRGDRFMTTDCTPHTMTSWGYLDIWPAPNDGATGGMLSKLLFRLLPDHYPTRSIYAHFPFLDPVYLKQYMLEHDPKGSIVGKEKVKQYVWERPAANPDPAAIVVVSTAEGIHKVLSDPTNYESGVTERLQQVIGSPIPPLADGISSILLQFADRFGHTLVDDVQDLLKQNSYSRVGENTKCVDVLKRVIRVVATRWVFREISGFSFDQKNNDPKLFTEDEWASLFENVAEFVFLNGDPSREWQLRHDSQAAYKNFVSTVRKRFDHLGSALSLPSSFLSPTTKSFLKAVHSKYPETSHQELATAVFCATVPTVALWVHLVTTTVYQALVGSGKIQALKSDLVAWTGQWDEQKESKVFNLIKASIESSPLLSVVQRMAIKNDALPGSPPVTAGSCIYIDFSTASKENRLPFEHTKGHLDDGLLAPSLVKPIAGRIIASILSLKDIRTGPGPLGQLNSYQSSIRGVRYSHYVNAAGEEKPWPDSLVIEYSA